MLREPEAMIAEALGVTCEVDGVAEGLSGAAADDDRREVEDRKRNRRHTGILTRPHVGDRLPPERVRQQELYYGATRPVGAE